MTQFTSLQEEKDKETVRLTGHFLPQDHLGQGLIWVTEQGQWEKKKKHILSGPRVGTLPTFKE